MSSPATKIEPHYVLDTHTLIWYLTADKRLGKRAKEIFQAAERGETQLVMSAIVIAELYYANKKWSLFSDFSQEYAKLAARPEFQFIPVYADDILAFDQNAAVPEMHDRIIAGLARRLSAPLLTSDPLITASGVAPVVW